MTSDERPDTTQPPGTDVEAQTDSPGATGASRADGAGDDRGGSGRGGGRRVLAAVGGLVTLLLIAGAGWLFLGAQPEPHAPYDPRANPCVDGLVMAIDESRLVLRTDEEDARMFEIRERDLPRLDIPHLESHSAMRQQTRVYYEAEGDTEFVVAADDAPLTTGPGNEDLRC